MSVFPYERRWENGKTVYRHREIMEQIIGRSLRAGECVHHKNGDTWDNRPENLELCESQFEHSQRHRMYDPFPILEAYDRGLSSHGIAQELSIPRRTVSNILREHGASRNRSEAAALMWKRRKDA